jgi:Alginate export
VLPDNSGWSSVDHHQNFYGAWGTYRPQKGTAFDLYYLFLDNVNHTTALGLVTAPTSLHTLGTRYSGDKCGFLWDAEGMLQLGSENGKSIYAGSATAGLGYNWKNLPMNPTVWAYYDWASGDRSPNAGNYETFNQLFPFGHYYFGFIDQVGRQNIRDWNVHLYLNPTKWITFNAQYHFFSLDKAEDALYNAAGAPIRVNTKGAAGGVVGQELDVFLNFHLTNRTDVLAGYSKLNAGEFISNTGNGRSPELFYLMYNVRW